MTKAFYVVGINHQNTALSIREQFSFSTTAQRQLLEVLNPSAENGAMVLSTCNRSELYAFGESAEALKDLYLTYNNGNKATFDEKGYIFKGADAVRHLFKVSVGLDSQILGDFEIIGQIKNAYRFSKKHQKGGAYLERLLNTIIQTGRSIKNETAFSSGATSTAYAAVQYLKHNIKDLSQKRVLLYGTGKIGRITCENLCKNMSNDKIKVTNRTLSAAQECAELMDIGYYSYEQLPQAVAESDIVIVATGAPQPTVTADMTGKDRKQLFIDLSVPRNVAQEIQLEHEIIDVDQLSQMTTETLNKRRAEVPKVETLLDSGINEFLQWAEERKIVPMVKALQDKFLQMGKREIKSLKRKNKLTAQEEAEILSERLVQKITGQFYRHLKTEGKKQKESMELLNQMFDLKVDNA